MLQSRFFSCSYSFELNPSWSKAFSDQEEIRHYLQDVANKYGITQHIEFGKGVSTTVWNEENDEWTVTLHGGEVCNVIHVTVWLLPDKHRYISIFPQTNTQSKLVSAGHLCDLTVVFM